jgi:predicted RNase H-like HicB family nuclease
MIRYFTLEYWIDDGWYVGRLPEVPGVFSQGETLDELKDNIMEAYHLIRADIISAKHAGAKTVEIEVAV